MEHSQWSGTTERTKPVPDARNETRRDPARRRAEPVTRGATPGAAATVRSAPVPWRVENDITAALDVVLLLAAMWVAGTVIARAASPGQRLAAGLLAVLGGALLAMLQPLAGFSAIGHPLVAGPV